MPAVATPGKGAVRKRQVSLERSSAHRINAVTLDEQLHSIAKRAIGKTFHRFGWSGKVGSPQVREKNGFHYTVELEFVKKQERERHNSEKVASEQFGEICRKLIQLARSHSWKLSGESASDPKLAAVISASDGEQQDSEIIFPQRIDQHFAHIFARESQIRIVESSIRSAVATSFSKRHHCLLWGKPACGKTEILLGFENALGPHNVMKLDATMTSKAGAENLLLNYEGALPRFIILEEAEKCDPSNLPWLLGVLDQRGEIIKTNARIGSQRREAKCLVLATVNNIKLFKSVMSGALASRFQHKVYCPRPTTEVLRKILEREVKEIGGNRAWIDPVMKYCIEVEKTDDPRRLISVLDGKDDLLNGKYQKHLQSIHDAMEADGMGGENPDAGS